ncbi:hypothetical protein ACH5RR_029892 [Cinchona calisaya]|uniref:Uncharacterized protein n=1 Tax=Cinchona calisaya TaxID=153742 RepID=A0ABD2YV99_9GENT
MLKNPRRNDDRESLSILKLGSLCNPTFCFQLIEHFSIAGGWGQASELEAFDAWLAQAGSAKEERHKSIVGSINSKHDLVMDLMARVVVKLKQLDKENLKVGSTDDTLEDKDGNEKERGKHEGNDENMDWSQQFKELYLWEKDYSYLIESEIPNDHYDQNCNNKYGDGESNYNVLEGLAVDNLGSPNKVNKSSDVYMDGFVSLVTKNDSQKNHRVIERIIRRDTQNSEHSNDSDIEGENVLDSYWN